MEAVLVNQAQLATMRRPRPSAFVKRLVAVTTVAKSTQMVPTTQLVMAATPVPAEMVRPFVPRSPVPTDVLTTVRSTSTAIHSNPSMVVTLVHVPMDEWLAPKKHAQNAVVSQVSSVKIKQTSVCILLELAMCPIEWVSVKSSLPLVPNTTHLSVAVTKRPMATSVWQKLLVSLSITEVRVEHSVHLVRTIVSVSEPVSVT